ncbi:carotenoid 9 [Quercus suber]|uniref:Carotenoid 9 n=1 Tax=Quercus suber TaxID=58331 RepID=A0AAW0MCC2_QUESU
MANNHSSLPHHYLSGSFTLVSEETPPTTNLLVKGHLPVTILGGYRNFELYDDHKAFQDSAQALADLKFTYVVFCQLHLIMPLWPMTLNVKYVSQ